jgi:integrase
VSIKPAGKGKWLVRVARTNKRTGRRENRKETVFGTKALAQAVERELEQQLAAGVSRPRRIQLRAFANEWLASRVDQLKPSVRMKYATSLDLHILPALGDFYLDAIRPSDVRSYVSERLRAKAAGNTVLNELRLMRTIARDSVAEGLAAAYWCDRVEAPAVAAYSEERPNLHRADQLQAMLAQVPRYWLGLVTLMGLTGLRWGEASALRWEDVEDFTADGRRLWAVRVRRSNWKGTAVKPKTDRSARAVPLPALVATLLGPRQATGLIFPTREGELHKGTPLRKVIDRACAAAGVPRITPHGLRRSWNDLARRVASREVVMAVTGHATEEMFAHYSVVDIGEKSIAVERVAALLAPPPRDPAQEGVPNVSQSESTDKPTT